MSSCTYALTEHYRHHVTGCAYRSPVPLPFDIINLKAANLKLHCEAMLLMLSALLTFFLFDITKTHTIANHLAI